MRQRHRAVGVLGKGGKRRLIPVSAALTATVDEYMLTPYPTLDRLSLADDFLSYPAASAVDALSAYRKRNRQTDDA